MRVANSRQWVLELQMGTELKRTLGATIKRFRQRARSLDARATDSVWEQNKYVSRMLSSWDREKVRDYSSM